MSVFTRSIGPLSIPEGPYVLLVDDEWQSLEPLGELVRFSGIASVTTSAATDALACCFHRRPAVLVTDLVMPRTDGRALARRIRLRHPKVPILLITGQNLEDPDWRIPEGLFDGVFAKPLDLDRFLTTLGRLVGTDPRYDPQQADLDRPGRLA